MSRPSWYAQAKQLHDDGLCLNDIADQLERPWATVQAALSRGYGIRVRGRKKSPRWWKRAKQLWDDGYNIAEVAKQCKKSRSAVTYALAVRYGITETPTRERPRKEPAWRRKARVLHEFGVPEKMIARRVKKARRTVRQVLPKRSKGVKREPWVDQALKLSIEGERVEHIARAVGRDEETVTAELVRVGTFLKGSRAA